MKITARFNIHAAAIVAALCIFSSASVATAQTFENGGKLLLTRGVSTVGGAAGGGIVPWALITGNETDRGIGGAASATYIDLPDYTVHSVSASAGFYNRLELSYAHQILNTGDTGTALGIGQGAEFKQDIIGAKVRVFGDAVFDQDKWLPQMAVGLTYKSADQSALLGALGAEDSDGVEAYVSATKIILSESLLLGGTLRYTGANQNGLLGFGGQNAPSMNPEVSLGYLVSRRLLIGGEYRVKPNNLAFAEEDDWLDIFAAYAINDNMTATVAYADLGSIATFDEQRGLYLSLQLGF